MKMRMIDRFKNFQGELYLGNSWYKREPNHSRCFMKNKDISKLINFEYSQHGRLWNGDWHYGITKSSHNLSR